MVSQNRVGDSRFEMVWSSIFSVASKDLQFDMTRESVSRREKKDVRATRG